ncbi:DUF1269 domain-containing protein [Lichenihabitans psoromatis]|uniref:DUF1269 domain-containing protein n=1 Tax=Lichenihabitans psoromatis TaxID=2528642 RepID=UPI0010355427|nr:DUF1269 domain-containing protein [Lichenihabitans psoromatis]
MDHYDAAVAVFDMKDLSIVGKGYHTDEKVTGFYNMGDRVRFWGRRGAYWGGLRGLFFGGLFMTILVVDYVVVLGYLAAIALSAAESAVVVGGLSALGAALHGAGILKDSVLSYETALAADSFLAMARKSREEMSRAKAILGGSGPSRFDLHHQPQVLESVG